MLLESPHAIRYLEVLKDSKFLNGVEVSVLRMMLDKMSIQIWPVGTFKNSNEVKSSLHLIVSGRLKVYQINPQSGREHTIFLLSKGDVFDVLTLMDAEDHNVCWESLDEMEILDMSMENVRNWITQYPQMHRSILHYFGQRMRELEDVASDMSLNNTLVRLCHLLLKNINGETHQLQLINNLPNDEIASLIGTTRAVVSRHIQELKHCGAISVGHKHIDIQNIETLLAMAEKKHLS